jgi:hypothetical protein
MTTDEFASKIKAKYPQYKDMDNNELTTKIVAKYPQYKSQVTEGNNSKSIGNKAYDFAQETVPYIAGGMAGAAGAPLGLLGAGAGAGLGYAGAKTGLRGIGKILGYEKQNTLPQEALKTVTDFPTGATMEMASPAVEGVLGTQVAKRTGKGLADMFGTLPGVDTERIIAMFKNPKTILPPFLGGPPAIKEAGSTIGAIESKLGIPPLESEPIEPLYKIRPPKKITIANPEREGIDPSKLMKNIDPKRMPELQKALAEMKGPVPEETAQETAYRVHKMMVNGEQPTVQETVKALKGTNEALEKFPNDMTTKQSQDKLRLTLQAKRLQAHLSDSVPELQKARGNYAASSTRKAFTSPAFGLMAQSGGKDVSRMGANRLVGPFALMRMANNPAFGALLGASQSPLALGAGTAGLGAVAKAVESPMTVRAIQSLLETIRRKKQTSQGTGQ